jgi:hypothetical protein
LGDNELFVNSGRPSNLPFSRQPNSRQTLAELKDMGKSPHFQLRLFNFCRGCSKVPKRLIPTMLRKN